MIERFSQRERKISRFFARQMLHDYRNDDLDPARRKAVELSLQEDPELKRELASIDKAELYCRTLQGTRISPDFIDELAKERSIGEELGRVLNWKRWPEMARWTIEALAVSAVVVSFIVFVPWQSLKDQFVQRIILQDSEPVKISIPEVLEKKLESKEDEQNRLANLEVEAIEKSIEDEKPSGPASAASAPAIEASAKSATSSNTKTVSQGLLYRMMMRVPDIAQKTADVKRRIQDMGAAKAGNVELGWRKPNGNYFHFSFPESRYQTLLSVLGEYGSVRVYKNPHERVMPEGQIRVILWIEDAVSTPTKDSAAPGVAAPSGSTSTTPSDKVPSVELPPEETEQ
jgi:hypothetical protein